MRNLFNTTTIEDAIVALIRAAGVSDNVFTNRPRSSTQSLSDFVVCKVVGNITDRCALGECTVSFSLYAKDISNIKNGKKLSVLQDLLLEGLPYESGTIVFKPFSMRILGDAPDNAGYHARVITIQAFIKISE